MTASSSHKGASKYLDSGRDALDKQVYVPGMSWTLPHHVDMISVHRVADLVQNSGLYNAPCPTFQSP